MAAADRGSRADAERRAAVANENEDRLVLAMVGHGPHASGRDLVLRWVPVRKPRDHTRFTVARRWVRP